MRVLINAECFVCRLECNAKARFVTFSLPLHSRATRAGRHCIGWARPCFTVKDMASRANPVSELCDVEDSAASMTFGRYRWIIAELTLRRG